MENRTIKFRIWDKENKKMYFPSDENDYMLLMGDSGYFSVQYHANYNIDTDKYKDLSVVNSLDNELELMQFTGLLDKNGKEIYEGDVIQIHDPELDDGMGPNYQLRTIEYKSGGFLLEWDYGDYDITYLGWALEWLSQRGITVEVIGNVYYHPKLSTPTTTTDK